MDPIVLKLTAGNETLAELKLTPSQGATPMSANYKCVLDGDEVSAVNLANIPKRSDPLQVAVDALHLLAYSYSGRKAVKSDAKKNKIPPAPHL